MERFLKADLYRMQQQMRMQADGSITLVETRAAGAWHQISETAIREMEAAAGIIREGMPRSSQEVRGHSGVWGDGVNVYDGP